jgi:tRNA threonylcarbamoyladenosine biosynthesis protein TsaB
VLVAIDTSTQLAGLALFDGAVQAELIWQAGRRHSSELLPQLERLLALLPLDVSQLRAVAVARGPGSYTGVRVGLAVAQGLAVALGVPAYGVCTLDVLAAGQESSPLPIRPLVDAGRKRYATALYSWVDGQLVRQSELTGLALAELPDLVRAPTLLCGDLDDSVRLSLRAMLGADARLASPAASVRRPAVLAQLAWDRFLAGEAGDPAALEPIYLAGS